MITCEAVHGVGPVSDTDQAHPHDLSTALGLPVVPPTAVVAALLLEPHPWVVAVLEGYARAGALWGGSSEESDLFVMLYRSCGKPLNETVGQSKQKNILERDVSNRFMHCLLKLKAKRN